MNGYAGKILWVDLSSGTIESKPTPEGHLRDYLGGSGLAAKMFLDILKEGGKFDIDPLSAENPSIIMTGPLCGTRFWAVPRFVVCARSPLTGIWGESNVGGYFGAELKFAGFDGVVIAGASERPVYLYIEDGTAELRDAGDLWGRDAYEVSDILTDRHSAEGKKKGDVFCIGPAAERGVLFASIVDRKAHVAGRTGIGAVWGAKGLKAVFVRGTSKFDVADPERYESIRKELLEFYKENLTIQALHEFGTCSHMDVGILLGDIPMKNWQQTEWDEFDDIGPLAYAEKALAGKHTCYACGVRCKRVAEVKEGPFAVEKGSGPEYETVAAFGTMCLNSNFESIVKCHEICNRYGMDTITCGSTIAFAIECTEKGIISKAQLEGLDLAWGNAKAIVKLTEMIAKREGFLGQLLSLGSAKAADALGKEAKRLLATSSSLEAPMHDPRAMHGLGLSYATSTRGACHMASQQFPVESGGQFLPEFPETVEEIAEQSSDGKAAMVVRNQDFGNFFGQCAIFCNLGNMVLNATQAVDMVNVVTGFGYTLDDACAVGRRCWYIKRGICNLFGYTRDDDAMPERITTPLDGGPTAGSVPDMELMLAEFYELRKLDEDGRPKREVLAELGLSDLADILGV